MKKIKCVVWDLDHTIWNGVLAEDETVTLNCEAKRTIELLDSRGILQSISSKNEYSKAMNQLKEFQIDQYFLYPQISWDAKSSAILRIKEALNIGMDTFAFIDDQIFEREEVRYHFPEVTCYSEQEIQKIPDLDPFIPSHLTGDSKNRRQLYRNDMIRDEVQKSYEGTEVDFLRSLNMKFYVDKVGKDDLARAEELTVRTHQLNATGYTYSYEELELYSKDPNYSVLIAGLEDTYGTYGKIGLALIEKRADEWTLKLLLMSCRVMSRGVGTALLNFIIEKAREAGVSLKAEFVSTESNRRMYVTYKFAGFEKFAMHQDKEILKADYAKASKVPDYVKIITGQDFAI